jgi:hypothetical protein
MAVFPCDATGHRFPGRQYTMYPAIVSGALASRRKLRLCKAHYDDLWDQLNTHAMDATAEVGPLLKPLCFLCDQVVGGNSSAIYVTCYGDENVRMDWYAPLHDNCLTV